MDLKNFSPDHLEFLASWLDSSNIPQFEYRGMSVKDIVETIGSHPLVAIIMLDRLTRDSSAFRMIIGERGGRLVFVLRDAPPGHRPAAPVSSALTKAITDSFSGFLQANDIDPTELQFGASMLPEPLWAIVALVARTTSESGLEGALKNIRERVQIAGDLPEHTDEALSELQRIGLVLRLIDALATDDLRKLRASAKKS
jgi:hypothetical protein